MSEVLTNNAAAAIMYPIAAELADQLGIHPNTMSVAVMLGGSAGWILPYSYQCNLMVYAAGKYETKDFIKIGVPYYVSGCRRAEGAGDWGLSAGHKGCCLYNTFICPLQTGCSHVVGAAQAGSCAVIYLMLRRLQLNMEQNEVLCRPCLSSIYQGGHNVHWT